MKKIGIIGLGAMGAAMAQRFLSRGYEVSGYNRTMEKAKALKDQGLRVCSSPCELAQSVDITICMVSDDQALRAVSDGESGLISGLSAGKTLVQMSTVSPGASRELAQRAGQAGAAVLEAPVSGSVPQVEQGILTILVGGDRAVYEALLPTLQELGKTVRYVGPLGQAMLLKLAVNVSLAMQMIALSEGVLLAERWGVDRKVAVDTMMGTSIASPTLLGRAQLLINPPEGTWFSINLLRKDLGLALDAGKEKSVRLGSAQLAHDVLTKAKERGFGDRDIATVLQALASIDTPSR